MKHWLAGLMMTAAMVGCGQKMAATTPASSATASPSNSGAQPSGVQAQNPVPEYITYQDLVSGPVYISTLTGSPSVSNVYLLTLHPDSSYIYEAFLSHAVSRIVLQTKNSFDSVVLQQLAANIPSYKISVCVQNACQFLTEAAPYEVVHIPQTGVQKIIVDLGATYDFGNGYSFLGRLSFKGNTATTGFPSGSHSDPASYDLAVTGAN